MRSSEAGTAYLVRDNVIVQNVADITSLADGRHWNAVAVQPGVLTPLSAENLVHGSYRVYTADRAGNLSARSDALISITGGASVQAAPTFGLTAADLFDGGAPMVFDAWGGTSAPQQPLPYNHAWDSHGLGGVSLAYSTTHII